jgi:hypothetical protein
MSVEPSANDPVAIRDATISSAFHKFANASLGCLVASFAVNILLDTLARQAARDGALWVFVVVNGATTFLMLVAMVCGVMALCGIRRYGKRKLLWKGLVGLLVPILLVAAAIPAFLTVRRKAMERARQQQTSP